MPACLPGSTASALRARRARSLRAVRQPFSNHRLVVFQWLAGDDEMSRRKPRQAAFRDCVRSAKTPRHPPVQQGKRIMTITPRRALATLTAAVLLAAPAVAHAETIRIGLPTKTYWPTTVAEA